MFGLYNIYNTVTLVGFNKKILLKYSRPVDHEI